MAIPENSARKYIMLTFLLTRKNTNPAIITKMAVSERAKNIPIRGKIANKGCRKIAIGNAIACKSPWKAEVPINPQPPEEVLNTKSKPNF